MRRFLTLSLLLAASGVAAQGWFPDGSVWHYDYNSLFGQVGFVRIEVAGDTSIGGQACRKLVRTREAYDHIGGQYHVQPLGSVFVYEANGLVMAHAPMPGTFDTLYHMAAVPGDRWRLARLPYSSVCEEESHMLVTDTGTASVGGVPLRWLAVEFHWMIPETRMDRDTIIERIGTRGFYLLPHDPCNGFADGHEGGGLRCYGDADIGFMADPQLPCDFIVSGEREYTATQHLKTWPNPAEDRLWVEWPRAVQGAWLTLRDMRGRVVVERSMSGTRAELDVSRLGSGVYVVEVAGADMGGQRTKFVKR